MLATIRAALRRPAIQNVALAAPIILVLIARRPDQFLHPEVWVEEGRAIFPDYLRHGVGTLLQPVSGYLITATKLLFLISIHISFEHYAIASYVLTLAFSAAVALTIFRAPTLLPVKAAMALTPFLIPINPEVFGVGLYIFWIVGLLSALPLLWRLDGSNPLARVTLTLIGGLSCPLGIALLPLNFARAIWRRTGADFATLAASLATTAAQLRFILTSRGHDVQLADNLNPQMIPEKFVGDFVLNIQGEELISAIVGALLIIAALAAALISARRGQFLILALGLCCGAAIGVSVLRVPLYLIDAHGNAPRYFFYPFVFLGWLALVVWHEYARLRRFVTGLLVIAFLNGLVEFSQLHEDLDWPGAARACKSAESGLFTFDIQYDGRLDRLWRLEMSAEECRKLSRGALFG